MTSIRSAVFIFGVLAMALLTVQVASAQPCTPVYSTGCNFGDGLILFRLNTMDQTIPCTGSPSYYHDFTATSTQLKPGTAYTLTVQAGYSATYVTVWVDLDNDGIFESAEILVSNLYCASSYTDYTTTLTIPMGTSFGNHRLRYRTSWLASPGDPCSSLSYGNSADFTVYVLGGSLTIGDTVSTTGNVIAPKVSYTSPREHVTSVSSEAFFPTSNVDYGNGGGSGGAWKPAGADGIMAAAVKLPDGARVTKFRVYFYDNSAQDLQISLEHQGLMWGGYATMAEVTTSGAQDAYTYLETTDIAYPVINNVNNGYLIWVFPLNTWDSINLRVKGASIYYTLAEAP